MAKSDILSLKMKLETAKFVMNDAQHRLTLAQKNFDEARRTCDHEFTDPYVGFEHEGGICKICGVNELYARTLKGYRANAS